MSPELGRIERPDAEPYKAERKIYLVPLVYSPKEPPADYIGRLERYWAGAREHVRRLEDRIGVVNRIYHESVSAGGEEGLATIEQISHRTHEIARQKAQDGAEVVALEDEELLAETVDWQRCLMIGLASRKASEQIWSSYRDASRKRNEHLIKRIDETLGPGEAGLLFIREDHGLQFPTSLRVFFVSPPALDEIHRWQRDRAAAQAAKKPDQDEQQEQP